MAKAKIEKSVEFASSSSAIEGNPRWELAQRVARSSILSRAPQLQAILLYIVRQAILQPEEPIHEFEIAHRVLGRRADFNPMDDSIVRTQVAQLRKRLDLHFSNEGKAEEVVIGIGLGSYVPIFSSRSQPALVPPPTPAKDSLPVGTTVSTGSDTSTAPVPQASRAVSDSRLPSLYRFWSLSGFILAGLVILAWAGQRAWTEHLSQASDQFWDPLTQTKGPVLICTGGVAFSHASEIGTTAPDDTSPLPYLSFEEGLAMGRVAALLSSKNSDYRIESPTELTLDQMTESPVVLIGAYNNAWTQRLLLPLRFHFTARSDEAIVDTWHPQRRWYRDGSKPFSETPDYGLVARFRNPSTNSTVVVVAGLQRYGTDAASQFAVSSQYLRLFNQQVGSGWTDKNVEVVIRVDVVNGRAGAPIIEETYVW